MKKTFKALGVTAAVACGTLAFAVTWQGGLRSALQASPAVTASTETDTTEADSEETTPTYGVSIGTVEGQLYSESGLDLENFDYVKYVAQTSTGTYMGFGLTSNWVYDEETDEEIEVSYLELTAISSNETAVTIPDYIKVGDKIYTVKAIEFTSRLGLGSTSSIQTLTVPSTVTSFEIPYTTSGNINLVDTYMLGTAPTVNGYNGSRLNIPKIYVCDKNTFSSYKDNDGFANSAILPYGWDFEYEWVTVNVEKNGEFAESYLTQNNYDWDAVKYLKVTGNINDIDLSAIKNLTSLMKLDLSETTITSLPDSFMKDRKYLSEVKLPSTFESLGSEAFSGCLSLQSFDLNGITTIGAAAFRGCTSLSHINLNGVETIGQLAFYGCSGLSDIDLSTVSSIGAYAFNGCSRINNIDLSHVTGIDSGAFARCTSLESVDLSSAVNIGDIFDNYPSSENGSFYGCTALKEIKLGEKLKTIGSYCFSGTPIETITLPETLTIIGSGAFSSCKNLTTVDLPASLTNIPQSAFAGCTSLTSAGMKSGIISIGTNAFNGCSAIEEISIPATVKSIGSEAFSNTGIKDFKCYAAVPPAVGSNFIGGGMDMTRVYLHVPPFSKDFYRNTEAWTIFYLMRSIQDPIDYILVDRPLSINLEEEDNAAVANNPTIVLKNGGTYRDENYNTQYYIGQLTATGQGTLSAGQLSVDMTLATRSYNSSSSRGYVQIPTLINYADKMRADNVTFNVLLRSRNRDWHFISLPFDVKVSEIIPSDNTYWVIRRYDSAARAAGETSSTWVNLTNDDTMVAGKGYIISATGGETYVDEYDRTYTAPRLTFSSGNSLTKNNLFRPTDIIVPLTEYTAEFAHNRSWNLIGNPYPCYFDMHYLNDEFTAPVTVWNGSSYVAYSPVDDDLVLSPYEAFFVQCPLDAKEMTFKEGGRLHADEGKPLYKAPARNASDVNVDGRNVFNFEIGNAELSDRARIVLNPDAENGYEIGRDASKFFADNTDCAQIYVAGDVNYSISERPVGDGSAMLGVRASKEGVYKLTLSGRHNSDWHVIVTDNATGESVDLTETEYEFIATAGDSANRFSVRFMTNILSGVDSIVSDFGADAEVTVATAGGITVYKGRASEMNVPATGLYIVSNGQETRKAILK